MGLLSHVDRQSCLVTAVTCLVSVAWACDIISVYSGLTYNLVQA